MQHCKVSTPQKYTTIDPKYSIYPEHGHSTILHSDGNQLHD
jgi:hypothetical protein